MFFEKSVKMTAADVEIIGNICHCDILERTFFNVIYCLGNIKIIVGFSGCVGGMEFFLQHGNDPVETALDISFVSGSEPGAGHHFQDRFLVGANRGKLLDWLLDGEVAVSGKCGSLFAVKTDPDISPGICRLCFIKCADLRWDEKTLAGFQRIFPVIYIEISLTFQYKMDGIIPAHPGTVRLTWSTFFPSAGYQMEFF